MKRFGIVVVVALLAGCAKRTGEPTETPKAFGSAIIVVSGEKQIASTGSLLDQPVVVQVNDDKNAAVAGAFVQFSGANGLHFDPPRGLTGSDGQLTTNVTLGSAAGLYRISARTGSATGKRAEVEIDEVALGYQATLGKQISDVHCIRCHDSESTPERVSNHDNLDPPPHAFTDGATLNAMRDAQLQAIIQHGGPGIGKSSQMPPYGNTLSGAEIDALIAYLRAVADPPYNTQGVFRAAN